MREPEFRCWDIYNKKWLLDADTYDEVENQGRWNPESGEYYILQQYTGLKEINGKKRKIYEGDILQSKSYSWNPLTHKHDIPYKNYYEGVVVFGKIHISMGCGGHGEGDEYFSAMGFYVIDKWGRSHSLHGNLEIIGNIYENPELVDKKNV